MQVVCVTAQAPGSIGGGGMHAFSTAQLVYICYQCFDGYPGDSWEQ